MPYTLRDDIVYNALTEIAKIPELKYRIYLAGGLGPILCLPCRIT
ncbi:MAG: hypothetical protein QXJ06_05605 [Candidatus Aenigmatarchaeota archaeon]